MKNLTAEILANKNKFLGVDERLTLNIVKNALIGVLADWDTTTSHAIDKENANDLPDFSPTNCRS